MEEMSGRHEIDRITAEGELKGIAADSPYGIISSCEVIQHSAVVKMLDLEVEADSHPHVRNSHQQIRGPGADVENRCYASPRAPNQPPVDPEPAQIAVDAAEITERSLHVVPGRVVLVEVLLLVDPRRNEKAHGSTRLRTSAEFFEPNAIVLQTATSTAALLPTSGT